MSDEYSELPTLPEHNQTVLNHSYELSASPHVTTLFQTNGQKHCPTPYQQNQSDEGSRNGKEQTYKEP